MLGILALMFRPFLLALFTLLSACFSGWALADDVAIPDLGRRGDLPEGLTRTFSNVLRQEVSRTGLGVDPAELVTEGIAGSLDPFYTTLAARLLGTRYAVSGEIADGTGADNSLTINLIIVDTVQERQSDLISRSLNVQDLNSVARDLATDILAFTDLSQSLPSGDAGLFISSEPAGAAVYIGGLLMGHTGDLHMLELAAGRYTIELRLDGYLPVTRVEELRSGSTSFPHFRLTEIIGGSAQVNSEPVADVYHQGELLGRTPLNAALPAGMQQLTLVREGFRDIIITVDVRNNRVARVTADLQPVREPLVFWESEPGMNVVIDGQLQAGSAATDLRPGRTTFSIRRGSVTRDLTMVLPLTGAFRLDTELGALIPLGR